MPWTFLQENIVTILLALLLAVLVGWAVRFAWKTRHSCKGCAGCPHADRCRQHHNH